MYHYFSGKGSTTPAVKRAIIEAEMMEEHHWLPQDIKKIPYKELQMYHIINRQRTQTVNERNALVEQANASKARGMASSSGQGKTYR